jgi:hypothetical protein
MANALNLLIVVLLCAHALFIMIFRGFLDSCAFVPNARKGKPAS